MQEAWDIVKADPRELVEHVVLCCRHCYGNEFAYQWVDDDEFTAAHDAALNEYEKKRRNKRADDPEPVLRLPDDKGGYGYDPRESPHKDCPKCLGNGVGRPVFKDTRRLSRGALALFAGVKETKDGMEIKMHSKLDALEKVFRHLGMYDADKPPAANVSVSVQAGPVKRSDLAPADAYLIMVQGAKR